MAIKTYEAFRAPSPYEQERLRAERQRRYAELLEKQAMEQEGEFTYQGIRAMPSPAAALGKLLSAYQSKKARDKAEEAEARQIGMEQEAAGQIAGRLTGRKIAPVAPGAPVVPVDSAALQEQRRIEEEKNLNQLNLEEQAQLKAGDIQEVTRQSQYVYDPEGAMQRAMTPQGGAAIKGNPVLAAMLQKTMEAPAAEEFYAPTETANGLVQFSKRGTRKDTGYKPPPKSTTPTELARLMEEFNNLPPNDERRPIYEAKIKRETQGSSPIVNVLPTARDMQKDESGLRDQLQSRLKDIDWDGVRNAYQRIFTAPNTPVGDVAIVYAVAKADDPTGAVRQEDFDLRAKDGSLGGRIQSMYEEARTGNMLPERRQQLIDTAYTLYTARQNQVNSLIDEYGNIASRSGLNAQNVTSPFKSKVLGRRIVWSNKKQNELDELRRKGENK
jgi:hypothetical protein